MKTNITSDLNASSKFIKLSALTLLLTVGIQAQTITTMPDEAAPHEGTWLTWPHRYTYGVGYRNALDPTWIAMTKALVTGEKVHIIAYNAAEQNRITALLKNALVPLTNVNFVIRQSDDVWIRDNGPVFVRDNAGELLIADWGFNGWGFDTKYTKDNTVPTGVSVALGMPRIDINDTILENGALSMDGSGVVLATRSSTLEPKRNPNLTQADLEQVMVEYLGAKKFIWLDGAPGGKYDITDMHIDGFAVFAPGRKLVTLSNTDLAYWGLSAADITTLNNATDVSGVRYTKVTLPLTARDVPGVYFKGSYCNYYVANKVVLMPTYADANDNVAKNILQVCYPGRTVIGIDCRKLYPNGGMVHCVTQQQPR